MSRKLKAIEIKVIGRVQRVGYRRHVLDTAQQLKLSGYVENLRDGSVYIFAQGDEKKLEKFIELIREAPEPAKITTIKIRETETKPEIEYFTIKPGELWEELHEGFGLMQSIFYEYWKEFREFREEFQDYRKEFREFRGEFRNHRGEFKSFIDEFRGYREEFREFAKRTDENFKLILEKYGEISERLTTILETLREEAKETREILNTLREESKETRKILDMLRRESKETREKLTRALELLEKAITKLLEK